MFLPEIIVTSSSLEEPSNSWILMGISFTTLCMEYFCILKFILLFRVNACHIVISMNNNLTQVLMNFLATVAINAAHMKVPNMASMIASASNLFESV